MYDTGVTRTFGDRVKEISGLEGKPQVVHGIYLPRAMEVLKADCDIMIEDCKIRESGEEWLKLLGVECWAPRFRRFLHEKEYYIVPSKAKIGKVKI